MEEAKRAAFSEESIGYWFLSSSVSSLLPILILLLPASLGRSISPLSYILFFPFLLFLCSECSVFPCSSLLSLIVKVCQSKKKSHVPDRSEKWRWRSKLHRRSLRIHSIESASSTHQRSSRRACIGHRSRAQYKQVRRLMRAQESKSRACGKEASNQARHSKFIEQGTRRRVKAWEATEASLARETAEEWRSKWEAHARKKNVYQSSKQVSRYK